MCFVAVLGLRQVMYKVKGEIHMIWRFITCHIYLVSFFWGGKNSPQWARASSFTRFINYTQQCTTVGRTPLDE